jgi:hypothetical protein
VLKIRNKTAKEISKSKEKNIHISPLKEKRGLSTKQSISKKLQENNKRLLML